MEMEKKMFCSVKGVMGSQTVRGDERKMESQREGRGGKGRGEDNKIISP